MFMLRCQGKGPQVLFGSRATSRLDSLAELSRGFAVNGGCSIGLSPLSGLLSTHSHQQGLCTHAGTQRGSRHLSLRTGGRNVTLLWAWQPNLWEHGEMYWLRGKKETGILQSVFSGCPWGMNHGGDRWGQMCSGEGKMGRGELHLCSVLGPIAWQ
jgi:hypothetical protein